MVIKSKFEPDESQEKSSEPQYLKGGCGVVYNLGMGPGRVDIPESSHPSKWDSILASLGFKKRPKKPDTQ